jgi:circadian clock protein KaiB
LNKDVPQRRLSLVENKDQKDTTKKFEDSLLEGEQYVLSLFVAGQTPKSTKAITNIKKICEQELKGRYDLEIVDIYQEPERAKNEQLFAVPVLVKKLPAPIRKIIGDLSDSEKVLVGLNLRPKKL